MGQWSYDGIPWFTHGLRLTAGLTLWYSLKLTYIHEWSMIILMDKLEPVNCRCHAWAETAAASASWPRKCRRCSQMHLEKKETQHVTWNILFLFYFRNILVTICYHYKPVFGMYFDHRQIFLALKNNYSRWKVFLKILYFLVVKITM